jgi:alpha-glucoside transport system substrate-binding protein
MKKIYKLLAIGMVLSLALMACQPATPAEEAPAVEVPAEEAPEEPAAVDALPQGQELANAFDGMYEGTVVSMAGPFTDADAVKFDESKGTGYRSKHCY